MQSACDHISMCHPRGTPPSVMTWQLHRGLMLIAVALALIGFGIIVIFTEQLGAEHFASPHQLHGLVLTGLMVVQPLMGLIRPHKPEQPAHCTTRAHTMRTTWRTMHTVMGLTMLGWGIYQLRTGIEWSGKEWIKYLIVGGWALAIVVAAVGLMLSYRAGACTISTHASTHASKAPSPPAPPSPLPQSA